jgi:hypothetical protein
LKPLPTIMLSLRDARVMPKLAGAEGGGEGIRSEGSGATSLTLGVRKCPGNHSSTQDGRHAPLEGNTRELYRSSK